MQTIVTSYLSPTNNLGGRIAAKSASGKRIVISWNYAVGPDENHEAACRALMDKLDWVGEMIGGSNADGSLTWVLNDPVSPRVDRPYVGK